MLSVYIDSRSYRMQEHESVPSKMHAQIEMSGGRAGTVRAHRPWSAPRSDLAVAAGFHRPHERNDLDHCAYVAVVAKVARVDHVSHTLVLANEHTLRMIITWA